MDTDSQPVNGPAEANDQQVEFGRAYIPAVSTHSQTSGMSCSTWAIWSATVAAASTRSPRARPTLTTVEVSSASTSGGSLMIITSQYAEIHSVPPGPYSGTVTRRSLSSTAETSAEMSTHRSPIDPLRDLRRSPVPTPQQ